MKKKKIKWGFILVIIGFILILPLKVYALTDEEIANLSEEELKQYIASLPVKDEADVPAISPEYFKDGELYEYLDIVNNYLNKIAEDICGDGWNNLIIDSSDYSTLTCKFDDLSASKNTKIHWAYFSPNVYNTIKNILDNINGTKDEDGYNLNFYDLSYIKNYDLSTYFKKIDPKLNYYLDGRGGQAGYFIGYKYSIGFLNGTYNEILYPLSKVISLEYMPVFYIPSNVNDNVESYKNAAIKRIKETLNTTNVIVEKVPEESRDVCPYVGDKTPDCFKKTSLTVGELNENKPEILEYINTSINSENLNFYDITVNDKTYTMLIVKATDEQLNTSLIDYKKDVFTYKATDNTNDGNTEDDKTSSDKDNSINDETTIPDNKKPTNGANDEIIENPKTGAFMDYSLLILGIGGGLLLINICKKKTVFYKL